MRDIIVGSEALADGIVTRRILRTKFVKVHHNVYAPARMQGISAAAMHGTRWLPDDASAELVYPHLPPPAGIVIHRDTLAEDEVCMRASIDCTTPARTAYDIGRRTPADEAIIRIDALLNATGCTVAEVESIAKRYRGARGIRQLRVALDLVDGGAESPKETELRLLLVRDGLPRPVTQIPEGKRRIDMGWPASNTSRILTTTPRTSSASNSLPHAAGRSCASARDNCGTPGQRSCDESGARSAISTCRNPARTSYPAGRPRPFAKEGAAERNSRPCTRRTSSRR